MSDEKKASEASSSPPATMPNEILPPVSQTIPARRDQLRNNTSSRSRSHRTQEAGAANKNNDGGRQSILTDEMFGQNYNYSMAEAATGSNPVGLLGAVGRDVGNMLFGSLGLGPKPENNPEMCAMGHCEIRKQVLKDQAAEHERKEEERKRRHKEHNLDGNQDKTILKKGSISWDTGNLEGDVSDADSSYTPKAGKDTDDSTPSSFNIQRDSTSSASGDITVSGTGHYNPRNDVILRMETISPAETRFLILLLWVWLSAATAFLLYNFAQKLMDGDGAIKSYKMTIINVVMGTISLAAISLVCVTQAVRILYNVRQKKVWKPRRLKTTIFTSIELAVQWLNLLFFVLPNYLELGPKCWSFISVDQVTYFSLARWTMWNCFFLISLIHGHNTNIVSVERSGNTEGTIHSSAQTYIRDGKEVSYKDVVVNDLPHLKAHWWKYILWFAMECAIVLGCVYYGETALKDSIPPHAVLQSCGETRFFTCRVTNTQLGFVSIMVFFALVYFALYCFFIIRAFRQLGERSNTEFKIANTIVRLQVRLRLPAFTLFTLSLILLWFVKPFSCTSLFDTWWGMLPGQLATSGCVLLTMFATCPKMIANKERPPVLQVWLQEFCWTEEDKQRKLDRRNQTMAEDERHRIEKEPMFCVETMMKCLYWSLLIYDFDEVDDSRLSLEEGCALFSPPLSQYELFWEKSLDTKMILAWNKRTILMSFRGTASLANVMADLQAWRAPHFPKRGNWWSRPKVHAGFDKAWRNNMFNEKVMKRVEELFQTGEVLRGCETRFVITGHSLGGALSTLCAFDLKMLGRKYGCDAVVTNITFGSPRVGNHAFAREFESLAPDTWHMINDQDVVARGAKFLFAYKRGGHRVLINNMGDLIVRPNAMEASMRLIPCSGSVAQHLLTSYMQSLLQVLLAQFTNKSLDGGMTGVVNLVKRSIPIKRVLMDEAGLELKDLLHLARWGQYAPKTSDVAKIPITGRRSGAVTRDMNNKSTDDSNMASTRGGFFCGCCAPVRVRIKEAKSSKSANNDNGDANLRDGGDTGISKPAKKRLDDQSEATLQKIEETPDVKTPPSLSSSEEKIQDPDLAHNR